MTSVNHGDKDSAEGGQLSPTLPTQLLAHDLHGYAKSRIPPTNRQNLVLSPFFISFYKSMLFMIYFYKRLIMTCSHHTEVTAFCIVLIAELSDFLLRG